jgi:hypothetical protein
VGLLLGSPSQQREGVDREHVPDARGERDGVLRVGRQASELRHHQGDDVVRVPLRARARDVDLPGEPLRVEAEEPVGLERGEEPDREEGVPRRLLRDEARQLRDVELLRRAPQRVGDELAEVRSGERGEHHLAHRDGGLPEPAQHRHDRVRRGDLVVPVCSYEEQVFHVGVREQILDDVERRSVQPLQVVEEQRERLARAGEHGDEAAKDELETLVRVARRQLRDGGLLAEDDAQLGDEIHDEPSVPAQRLAKRVAPGLQVGLALPEQPADEALERLRQGGVRDVALVLIELAGREQPARRDERLVQLVHHRRLTGPRVAGDEDQLRRAALDDAVERHEQRLDLALAPVQPLRDEEPARGVALGERKVVDATPQLPLREAAREVALDAGRRVVALLRGLREELHHDRGDHRWDFARPVRRRHGLPRDVAVHPFHRIRGREGERAGEHLVEHHAKRVEIAPRVDRPVHPPGLLGRPPRRGTARPTVTPRAGRPSPSSSGSACTRRGWTRAAGRPGRAPPGPRSRTRRAIRGTPRSS